MPDAMTQLRTAVEALDALEGDERLNLGEALALALKLVGVIMNFGGAQVGDTVQVPEIAANIGSQRWRIAAHPATRER